MKILDCESVKSTYTSLESILGVGRERMEVALENLDIEQFYAENPDCPLEYDRLLVSRIIDGTVSLPSFDQVCWFHITRTTPGNSFEQGILPLRHVIDHIWDFLYTLVDDVLSEEEWSAFRQNVGAGHYAHLYRMKLGGRHLWGPYALLIRDIAFQPEEVGNHDYLDVPEIVEDICICFSERYDIDLLDAYRERTKPCIVKFVDSETTDEHLLTALYYLYTVHRGDPLSMACNTCFDGGGSPIPKERILGVEYPNYSPPNKPSPPVDAWWL
jgi:hypothetical protein